MKKNIFIFLAILIFIQCGLPSINFYDDLNPPTNLEIISDYPDSSIIIRFIAFNYEENFTGYNVYIADTEENSNIRNVAKSHVVFSDGFYENDVEIEDKYILNNEDNEELPTITSEELLEFYNTSIEYGLTYGELENLYEKTESCYVNGELAYDIGDINPLAKYDKICNYKLRPYVFEYEITNLPNGDSIDERKDYAIVVTAYDNDAFIESIPSNMESTEDL
jgi:hypothetical protein